MAEEKISAFNRFKTEIESDLEDLHGHVEAVRTKLIKNTYNQTNKQGVLTHSVDHYLSCVELNHNQLQQLFRDDLAKWKQNLKRSKADLKRMNDQIQIAMAEHAKKLAIILFENKFKDSEQFASCIQETSSSIVLPDQEQRSASTPFN